MPQPPLLCEEGNAKDSSRYAHLQNPCQPCPDRTTVFLHEQIQTEEKDFPAEISEGNWGGARGCDGSAENRSTNAGSWCCRGCGSSVDDTGYRKWDRAAHRAAAAGLYRSRCAAMRLLHVRPAHERERTLDAQSAAERGRGTRRHDRKSLPLRRLQPLRRSGVGCSDAQRKPDRARRFAMRRQTNTSVTPLKTVGHATPRIDALERVTGKATYTNDIQL